MIKSLLSVGLLLLIVLPGCSKSHTPQPGLIGQWKLVSATDLTGAPTIDYAAGSMIELRSDSTYFLRAVWGITGTGTYSISVSNTGIALPSFLYLKDAGSSTSSRYEMQLNGLKLTLTGMYAIEYYQKL